MSRRAALLVVCAILATCGLGAPANALAVTIGIADQRPEAFNAQSFQRTRIAYVRIVVGWDAIGVDWQRAELDRWFATVRGGGLTPLVTFGRSREHPDDLPIPERYRSAVDAFRARYPWVDEYSTWNEANHCGARTCHRARLVAAYWRQLRIACHGCTVLAADLVDSPNLGDWVREFRHAAAMPPTRWGLHNYLDANRYRTTYTHAAISAIGHRAQLWLTETGGLVDRNNHSTTVIPQGFTHAAHATSYLFNTIRRVSPRIQRIYFYNFIADPQPTTWDSGFLNTHLQERKAYRVLRERLAALAHAGLLTGRRPA